MDIHNENQLAYQQCSLRLRHLQKVIGFNLKNDHYSDKINLSPPDVLPSAYPRRKIEYGYFFTLASNNCQKPYYTSEFHYSKNPIWKSFEVDTAFPIHLLSMKGIILQVFYKGEDETPYPITSWGIHFSGLISLPKDSSPGSFKYPPNTLVFKLNQLFYVSFDSIKNIHSNSIKNTLQTGFSLALSETKPSYSVSSLCRLHSTKRAQKQQEERREALKEDLKYKGATSESQKMLLKRKVENMHIRIDLLKEQLHLENNKLHQIQNDAYNLDAGNQDKGIELLEKYQHLNRSLFQLRSQEEKLKKDHNILRDTVTKVRQRRLQLLAQLPLVFPIKTICNKAKTFSICDVYLPDAENYVGTPDQSLSVALGFAAQLLAKIAHMVNIPLRYPITLMGSMSTIADLTSTQLPDVESQFPLYTRGKEREKLHFNYGVFLLNKNIAQIRWNCGLATSNLRQTLPNIDVLLNCLQNEDKSQPRAFMPDTIVLPLRLLASLRFNTKTPATLEKSYSLPLQEVCRPSSEATTESPLKKDISSDVSLSESETELHGQQTSPEAKRLTRPPALSSCSLDNGLDSISEGTQRLPLSTSGSFPNLCLEEDESAVSCQSILLLKSWHEDNPTPYDAAIASSKEQLLDEETPVKPSPPPPISDEGVTEHPEESSPGQKDLSPGPKEVESEQEVSERGAKKSPELDYSEDTFLNDVTSRAASLASQNCSFKFSFARNQE